MEDRSKNIQNMFNGIAGSYDFLNRLLSFRRDVAWRKTAIKLAGIKDGDKVLDLACGTGDMIAEIRRKAQSADVTGGDFSLNMLFEARKKLPSEKLCAADAHSLPFKDALFDKITIAFGFRNVTDKLLGLKEMHRVLKEGGTLCILEFSEPENKIFGAIYRFYFTKILPYIGGLVSQKRDAYEYLPDSVYKFPKRVEYETLIYSAGFSKVTFHSANFGIVTIAVITK